MNNKGFTLVELMATLVVLSIVLGITFSVFGFNFGETKKKTEEAFVETIKDSLDVYLTSSNAKGLSFDVVRDNSGNECLLDKTHGKVKIYKATTTFKSVIDSEYSPITQKDLVNPANKDKTCANADNIEITVYRDDDFVYYYSVDKSEFDCLENKDGEYKSIISNLPEGYDCE